MKTIEIKNFEGKVLFTHTCENNSIKITLEVAVINRADLYGADLCGANLCGANLSEADLRRANLCGANLREAVINRADIYGADLCGANLSEADLRRANLCGAVINRANLCGANLDFSCMLLWCGDLKANYDDKQVIQQLYHVLSHVKNSSNVSDELKSLLSDSNLEIANRFHRVEECGKLKK